MALRLKGENEADGVLILPLAIRSGTRLFWNFPLSLPCVPLC